MCFWKTFIQSFCLIDNRYLWNKKAVDQEMCVNNFNSICFLSIKLLLVKQCLYLDKNSVKSVTKFKGNCLNFLFYLSIPSEVTLSHSSCAVYNKTVHLILFLHWNLKDNLRSSGSMKLWNPPFKSLFILLSTESLNRVRRNDTS